eukprot:Transcript_1234.p1 GENE.Transcript_1234~~Transcript_1234.p1  ORF type:complete len:356 (-),score=77.57 Transcript_1234:135-1202(-)
MGAAALVLGLLCTCFATVLSAPEPIANRRWRSLNLLAPQDDDDVPCRDNCTKQTFCIHPPDESSATPDEASVPLANGWGIAFRVGSPEAKGKSCGKLGTLKAELCADAKGEYCVENFKEEAEEGEWTYEKALAPGQCVGVAQGTTDWFCSKLCKPVKHCRNSTICQCGPDPAEFETAPSPPAYACDDSNWDPKDPPCVSINGQDDYWCHTTCTSCKRYKQMKGVCICGPEAEVKIAERKEIAKHSCDLDKLACRVAKGGAQDCRSCADHISTCRLSPHRDDNGKLLNFKIDDCLDDVAKNVKDCSRCNKDRSKEAYKVRVGLVWEFGEAPEEAGPAVPEDWTKRMIPGNGDDWST